MPYKRTIIVCVIMLITLMLMSYVEKGKETPLIKSFSSFPKQIGKWSGTEARFEDKIYKVLGVEDSYLANYRHENGANVQVYMGYYSSQKKGDLIHSPKNCMPGSGWNITHTSIETLKFQDGDKKIIKLILQNGPKKQVVLYWFHSRGRVISSEYMQKIYLVIDSITRNRTDGSFVRLIAPFDNDEEATLNNLKEFAIKLFPILDEYIPS